MISGRVLLPRIVAPVRGRAVVARADFESRRDGPGRFDLAGLQGGGLDLGRGIELAGPGDSTGLEFGQLGQGQQEEQNPCDYDPEGLFKGATTLQDGHISRRAAYNDLADGEQMEEALAKQKESALEEAQKRRESTVVPTSPALMVDFLLNCEASDMEYFVAKSRNVLGPEFFTALDGKIGEERFLSDPDEDLLADLEALRLYVRQIVEAQDTVKVGVQAATDRLKDLLSSKNMKQHILDMAAKNQIDVALLTLLQQNIDGATAAGEEQAATFMTKVRDVCSKYVIVPEKQTEEGKAKALLMSQKAAQQPSANETTTAGGLIMPGR